MKTNKLIVPVAICCFFMEGCITTTTGTTAPVGNDIKAAELNYQLGARYYQAGSYELARDRLIHATELNPNLAIAYSTLALTYETLDNRRLAAEAYENAVAADRGNFDVQNAYAVFLCRQKEYDRARKFFDRAIKHAENDSSELTMTNAGVCMAQKPDNAVAESYFRAALDRKPKHGEALLQICLLKFKQEEYLSARAFLQRFMAGSKTTPGVLYLAARIEDMLGNDRGRTDYEDQLLREFPTSPEARKVVGSG